MNSTARGAAYEEFVETLYRTLLDAEGFGAVKVEKNKTDLESSSGCAHQIDIYWEFKMAGQTYQTAIECKAYNTAVSIGCVRDFYGVLADIHGLKGIVVSLFGFQSGAKRYAEHYNIDLKEIRRPTEQDWEGRVRNILHRILIIIPEIKSMRIDVTQTFLETLETEEERTFSFEGTNYDSLIVDSNGSHVASLEDIRLSLTTDNQAAENLEETLPYSDCFYNSSDGQRIPIDSVTVRYNVNVETVGANILGDEVAKAIMKDVGSGDIMLFDGEGNVRKVGR